MAKLLFNPISGNFDTVYDKAEEIKYTPTVGGDWTVPLPTTSQEALDSTAARLSYILSLSNTQQVYIDTVAGDDINGNGSPLLPFQTIQHALTLATNNSLKYIFYLAPGIYGGANSNIPGNVSLIGRGVDISFTLTYTAVAGDDVYPVYSGIGFSDFQMDLTLANVALPVFVECGVTLIRLDTTTGPRFVQILNSNINALTVRGNIAASNSLFVGTCEIRDLGSLITNACTIGIGITMESQATISMVASTFVGSITGSTSGPNTSSVRADSSSLSQGGLISGCNTTFADTAEFIDYTPATPGDWVVPPIQTADALDVLAATKFPSPSGLSSQYIRGDGTLADFPSIVGGGSSVNYYLNGSVSQGTILGNTYYQMSKTPITGAGTDFTATNVVNGLISEWITDVGDPAYLNIPAGSWNIQGYFSVNQNNIQPTFYVELLKYDGSVFSVISDSSANPETITNGTSIDLYYTSVAVPATTLSLTDRLAIRIYVDTLGNHTVTHHTEDSHLSQIVTTFSTGIQSLNGLSEQVQTFQTGVAGTDFAISSAAGVHTFDLPDASSTARGALTSADWTTFDSKVDTAINLGIGDAVFKQNNNKTLEFKTLLAGSNISLTPAADTITIAASAGTGTTEIFNTTVVIGAAAATITGVLHFKAPSNLTISSIVVQLYEKGSTSSGTLSVDIKKNTTPNNVGMTSIFSVQPSFNFAVVSDYATSSGTISTSSVTSGDYLRLDITSIPSGFLGKIQVIAYA
jgi:hypothetical protein